MPFNKKNLLLSLLATITLTNAAKAEISDEVHSRCKDVKDYVGCVNRNSSNSIGTDLWGGVLIGMSERQIRKVLGESIKCKDEPEPGFQHISYCHNPVPISLANEKAYINVELHNDKVKNLSIGINYSNECPKEEKYSTVTSTCKQRLKQRDRGNFAKIQKILDSKYGKEVELNSALTGKAWVTPNNVQIELNYAYTGSWVLHYSELGGNNSWF